MPACDDQGDPELLDLIRRDIRSRGPLPFSEFMELALHHAEHGYYARGPARLGRSGDYFTASDVGDAFGRCLARQLAELDERLGRPEPFTVVEFGGGRGLLARDVAAGAAAEAPSLARRLRYVLADTSPGMRRAAVREAPQAEVLAPSEVGRDQVGCALAVEMFDALPVSRIRRRSGALREIYIDLDSRGRLVEQEGPPRREISALAERYGAAPREGDEAEVCPRALDQLDRIAATLRRGFVLIVDYGHGAGDLYAPSRNRGTLLAYHRHAVNEEYLLRVGEQDLTAHVNFTALEDRAGETGLDIVGRTTQDRFLIANGILEPFEETDPDRWGDPARVRERLRVTQLIHPQGMGRIFHVLVLSKGVHPVPSLTGLRDPFAQERG